jgi:hypothetical protein
VLQQDGSLKRNPQHPISFPKDDDIWAMAPIPDAGYPKEISGTFDQAYSDLVQLLDKAWGNADQSALDQGVIAMSGLSDLAISLMQMERKPPYGPGNYGPSFRFLSSTPIPAPAVALGAQRRYQRIQQILDQAVNGEAIGAHGAFWRTLDRDGFVSKSVFGVQLIVRNAAGQFDADLSNLVRALEAKPPFDGGTFPRMPFGYPPVPQARMMGAQSKLPNPAAPGSPRTPTRIRRVSPIGRAGLIDTCKDSDF